MSQPGTDATLRVKLVSTLQGVWSQLGFDASPGNIKSYLADFHQPEERSAYLMANVDGGAKKIRAWGVESTSDEVWFAMQNVVQRRYSARVRAYYALELEGAGVNRLIDHCTVVRGAIKSLTTNLGGTVTLTEDVTTEGPEVVESGIQADRNLMLQATINYTARGDNPTF